MSIRDSIGGLDRATDDVLHRRVSRGLRPLTNLCSEMDDAQDHDEAADELAENSPGSLMLLCRPTDLAIGCRLTCSAPGISRRMPGRSPGIRDAYRLRPVAASCIALLVSAVRRTNLTDEPREAEYRHGQAPQETGQIDEVLKLDQATGGS